MAVICVSTLVLNVYSLNIRKREIRYWNSGNRTCHAKINSKNNLVTEVAGEHTSATKHISFCQVKIPKLYKRVTASSYGLNRLDGTMTNFQNIHKSSNLYIYNICIVRIETPWFCGKA